MTENSRLSDGDIVDLDPEGTPPRIGLVRRAICGTLGVALIGAALYLMTSPAFVGLIFIMGLMLLGGGAVLMGTALFPRLTFQKLNRSRWR